MTPTPPTPPQDSGQKAMPRFRVEQGSLSAHCCFEATVVETSKLDAWGDEDRCCECFELPRAAQICSALNSYDTHRALIEKLARALNRVCDMIELSRMRGDLSYCLGQITQTCEEALAAAEKAKRT